MDLGFWAAVAALVALGVMWTVSLVRDVAGLVGDSVRFARKCAARLRGEELPDDDDADHGGTATEGSTLPAAEHGGEMSGAIFEAVATVTRQGSTEHAGEVSGLVVEDCLQLGRDGGPPLAFEPGQIVRLELTGRRSLLGGPKDAALAITLEDNSVVGLSRFGDGSSPIEVFLALAVAAAQRALTVGNHLAVKERAYLQEICDGRHIQSDDDNVARIEMRVDLRLPPTPPSTA